MTANNAELAPVLDADNELRLRTSALLNEGEVAGTKESAKPLDHHSLQLWAALLILIIMSIEWEVYRRGYSSWNAMGITAISTVGCIHLVDD